METLVSLLHNKKLHNEILEIISREEPVSKFYIFMAAGQREIFFQLLAVNVVCDEKN